MANTKSGVRSFADLSAALQARAGATKSAAQAKSAADNDPIPEKDPNEKGNQSIPVDKDAAPAKQNIPDSKTNQDGVTSTLPAPAPAKTIVGEEKPAMDLSAKAAKVADGIRALAGRLQKKAEVTQPTLPPNTAQNTGSDGGATQPPSGGAGAKNNPDPAVKDAAPATPAATDKTEKPAPAPKTDEKGPIPADKTNTDSKMATEGAKCSKCGKMEKECGGCKSASIDEMLEGAKKLDPQLLLKIAAVMIETEENRRYLESAFEKHAGAEAARDLVDAAVYMEQISKEAAAAEEAGQAEANELWKSASEDERARVLRFADAMNAAEAGFKTDLEKAAYDAGVEEAAGLSDAGMLGQTEAPDGAAMDEAIMQALQQMVQSGEITPEIAAQIVEALQGGGGAEAGAMPPGMEGGAGGGAMPPGVEGGEGGGGGGGGGKKPKADEGEDKEAAAKVLTNLQAAEKLFAA